MGCGNVIGLTTGVVSPVIACMSGLRGVPNQSTVGRFIKHLDYAAFQYSTYVESAVVYYLDSVSPFSDYRGLTISDRKYTPSILLKRHIADNWGISPGPIANH